MPITEDLFWDDGPEPHYERGGPPEPIPGSTSINWSDVVSASRVTAEQMRRLRSAIIPTNLSGVSTAGYAGGTRDSSLWDSSVPTILNYPYVQEHPHPSDLSYTIQA